MPRVGRPFDVKDLRRRYRHGESLEALAVEHGIGQARLRASFHGAGVLIRNRSQSMLTRWKRLDRQGRVALVAAAHEAARGRRMTPTEVRRRQVRFALARQRTGHSIGRLEREIYALLADRVKGIYPQYPVRGYNIDLAIEPVAVEVHVSANHPTTSPVLRKRIKQLRKLGWSLLYVWITPGRPWVDETADKIIAAVQLAQGDPAHTSQYWVIRGTGEDAVLRHHRYHRTYVPTPIPTLDPVRLD